MTETPNERTNDEDEILDQDAVFDDPDETLDSGYSPPEHYRGEGFGTTADEQLQGESLEERERQEEPEADPYAEVDDDVLDDGEVGTERAGRLVDPDGGIGPDEEKDLVGDDVGIDGAASSAEEAAVHIVED
jgi:uncharacterized protein DUF5709